VTDQTVVPTATTIRHRAVTWSVVALIALLSIHVLWLYVIANESPVWFNSIFFVRYQLAHLLEPTPTFRMVGALFILYGSLLAWLLWSKASRLAAILWLPFTLWDVWFRFTIQLKIALAGDYALGYLIILGCAATVFALFANLLALWGTFVTHKLGVLTTRS